MTMIKIDAEYMCIKKGFGERVGCDGLEILVVRSLHAYITRGNVFYMWGSDVEVSKS